MHSLDDLIALEKSGKRIKFLFFWGRQPQRDGSIGAGCLSQWFPAPFTVDGITFATAEHYMMWRKATLFGDEESARRIVEARHPRQAKMLGRGVLGFDQQVWERERFGIVTEASWQKFRQQPAMQTYLTGTANRVLVEASPMDRLWGIGLAATDERAETPSRWRGLNLLGFSLMVARDRLTSGVASRPDHE